MKKTNDKANTKNIHANHRARMKKLFLENGYDAFSDVEMLEYFLFFGVPFKDTNSIAHALLDEYKTFHGVLNATYEGLMKVKGVGSHVALYIKSMHSAFGEYVKSNIKPMTQILCSEDAKAYCEKLFVGKQNEEFIVLCLNNNSEVINTKTIAKGTTSSVSVETKDISYFVMSNHCERVIVTHNHPNGNPTPSDEDLGFTSKLFLNLGINDITLIDHIIVSPRGIFSMYEEEKLNDIKTNVIRTHNFKPPVPNVKWTPYINSKLAKKEYK